jgi:hypothetical protein
MWSSETCGSLTWSDRLFVSDFSSAQHLTLALLNNLLDSNAYQMVAACFDGALAFVRERNASHGESPHIPDRTTGVKVF